MTDHLDKHVVVIGAGFTGLAAAYDLARRGFRVTVIEQDSDVGGLAGGFDVGGALLEKFYHHWFTSDRHIMALIRELGIADRIVPRATRTGMYFANQFFRLSTPLDLLRFSPLGIVDRVRLGVLALRARSISDWRALEALTAEEWLIQMGGERVYRTVWQPLLEGKFGALAGEISAVWIWNKLKLRGGSRGRDGDEVLCYFRGGFVELARRIADDIRRHDGAVETGTRVTSITVRNGAVTGVTTAAGHIAADAVIATPALPIIADLLAPHAADDYLATTRRVRYLANVCLVLQLDRSLSELYWLNVNDPGFPFVGIIEHTNFEPADSYGGKHIVYLSKYLPDSDPLYRMSDTALLEFSLPHIQRMFPGFERAWILAHHVWRARYAQPVVERHYSRLIPSVETPLRGCFIATMAQVYPEDRGTNYAVREGRKVAALVAARMRSPP